jgi:hypothetical protein
LVEPYIEEHKDIVWFEFLGGLKPGLHVRTWTLSDIDCENDVRVTRV